MDELVVVGFSGVFCTCAQISAVDHERSFHFTPRKRRSPRYDDRNEGFRIVTPKGGAQGLQLRYGLQTKNLSMVMYQLAGANCEGK